MEKMTEDQTILLLIEHLKQRNWEILSYCLGQQRGYDIVAVNSFGRKLFVEAKGAKASDESPTKKRPYFSSGQIKDHFGKAIVKSIETQLDHPQDIIAIAHPFDPDIIEHIGHTASHLKGIGIGCFWVKNSGAVLEENLSSMKY
jgi:hypothetical protein